MRFFSIKILALMLGLAVAIASCEPAYAQLSYKQIGASATGSAGGTAVATLAAPIAAAISLRKIASSAR